MMENRFNLAELAKKALDEALRKRGHVNVLIAGRTGVGKSTLVNAVFQGDFATTGQGRPVTPSTREITKEGVPLSIFDTRGLEMGNYAASLRSNRSSKSGSATARPIGTSTFAGSVSRKICAVSRCRRASWRGRWPSACRSSVSLPSRGPTAAFVPWYKN